MYADLQFTRAHEGPLKQTGCYKIRFHYYVSSFAFHTNGEICLAQPCQPMEPDLHGLELARSHDPDTCIEPQPAYSVESEVSLGSAGARGTNPLVPVSGAFLPLLPPHSDEIALIPVARDSSTVQMGPGPGEINNMGFSPVSARPRGGWSYQPNHTFDDYSVLQVRNGFGVEWLRFDFHVGIVMHAVTSRVELHCLISLLL